MDTITIRNLIIVFHSLKKKAISFWSIKRKNIYSNWESMSNGIMVGFLIAKIDTLKQT